MLDFLQAEAEGFEPSCPCEPKVFETWPFNRSGTLPGVQLYAIFFKKLLGLAEECFTSWEHYSYHVVGHDGIYDKKHPFLEAKHDTSQDS